MTTTPSSTQPAHPMNPDGVYVVIAAWNESQVIAQVIADLSRYLPVDQVLVVDDASGDDTAAVARQSGARVLRHVINRGQGAALATGITAALKLGAQVIVTFDADGQHQADDLPAMIQPLRDQQADIVLGTRFARGLSSSIPPLRRWILRLGVLLTRVLTLVPVTDTHNGYRALSAKAARAIRIRQDRMSHASEIIEEIRRQRLRFVERPVRIRYSEYSLGKGQRNRDAVRLLIRILLDKVVRP